MWSIALLWTFIFFLEAEAKLSIGQIETEKNWTFLDKFCFRSSIGNLKINLSYPKDYHGSFIYLYFDTPEQWDSAYDEKKSCEEKTSLTAPLEWTNCTCWNNTQRCFCSADTGFKSMRDRWWYVALGKCDGRKGLKADFQMHLTNGPPSDIFRHEFSCDEFAIFPTLLAFFIAFLIMLFVTIYFSIVLRSRQLFHSTIKLFILTLSFKILHLIFAIRTDSQFSTTGIKSSSNHAIGDFFSACSHVFFVLLLILMAKGFTITRAQISANGTVKILLFFFLYFFISIILFVADIVTFDPAIVAYRFDTVPGWCIFALHILGWVWFSYACLITVKHYPEKKNFYVPFYILFTVWFYALPCTILLANRTMDPWARQNITHGVELATAFLGHLFFLVLTRPSKANKNFPFHVRTTQIDIITENSEKREHLRTNEANENNRNPALDPTSFPRLMGQNMDGTNGAAAIYAIPMTNFSNFGADSEAAVDQSKTVTKENDHNLQNQNLQNQNLQNQNLRKPSILEVFAVAKSLKD